MKTLGKFSLFILMILVLGCGKKKPLPAAADTTPAGESQENDEGSLESRCFDGDPGACDELGH